MAFRRKNGEEPGHQKSYQYVKCHSHFGISQNVRDMDTLKQLDPFTAARP
jgi:hypothetical protein